MIAGIRPEKADYILSRPGDTPKSADERSIGRLWIKNFVIISVLTLFMAALFVISILDGRRSFMVRGAIGVAFVLAIDIFVISRYIRVKFVSPGRYKKTVAKFGREVLKAQITDPSAIGFFIDEDEYENIILLTADYLIQAQEFVYALKDLKSVTVSKTDIPEERVKKLQNEHLRNVLRRTYSMEITLMDGSRRKEIFAINSTEMQAFFGYIQQRAPQVVLQYK